MLMKINPYNTLIKDLHQKGIVSLDLILIGLLLEYSKEYSLLEKFSALFTSMSNRPYLERCKQALEILRNNYQLHEEERAQLVLDLNNQMNSTDPSKRLNSFQAAEKLKLDNEKHEFELAELIKTIDRQISKEKEVRLDLEGNFSSLWVAFFRHYPYLFDPRGLTFYRKDKAKQPVNDNRPKSELVKCWIRSRHLNKMDKKNTIEWLLNPTTLAPIIEAGKLDSYQYDERLAIWVNTLNIFIPNLTHHQIDQFIQQATVMIKVKVSPKFIRSVMEIANRLVIHRLQKMRTQGNDDTKKFAQKTIHDLIPCLIIGLQDLQSYKSAEKVFTHLFSFCPPDLVEDILQQLMQELEEDQWVRLARSNNTLFLTTVAQNLLGLLKTNKLENQHYTFKILAMLAAHLPTESVTSIYQEMTTDERYKTEPSYLSTLWLLVPYLPASLIVSSIDELNEKGSKGRTLIDTLCEALPQLSSRKAIRVILNHIPQDVRVSLSRQIINIIQNVKISVRDPGSVTFQRISYNDAILTVLVSLASYLPPEQLSSLIQIMFRLLTSNIYNACRIGAAKALSEIYPLLSTDGATEFTQQLKTAVLKYLEQNINDAFEPSYLTPLLLSPHITTEFINDIATIVIERCRTANNNVLHTTVTPHRIATKLLEALAPRLPEALGEETCLSLVREFSNDDPNFHDDRFKSFGLRLLEALAPYLSIKSIKEMRQELRNKPVGIFGEERSKEPRYLLTPDLTPTEIRELCKRLLKTFDSLTMQETKKTFSILKLELLHPKNQNELIEALISLLHSNLQKSLSGRLRTFDYALELVSILKICAHKLPQFRPLISTVLYKIYSTPEIPNQVKFSCINAFYKIQNLIESQRLTPIALANTQLPKDIQKFQIPPYLRQM